MAALEAPPRQVGLVPDKDPGGRFVRWAARGEAVSKTNHDQMATEIGQPGGN